MHDSTFMRYLIKFKETSSKIVVTRGWGEAVKGEFYNGYRVSNLQGEKVLEICLPTM